MPPASRRVIIIGGGHNGLVAAYYLAKAGLNPLVLERRETVGGCAVTEEIHPGFRCPAVAHSLGPFLPRLTSDLQLERHGLAMNHPAVRVFAPAADGRSICLYADADRTARELAAVSQHDGQAYRGFISSFAAIGKVLSPLMSLTPPSSANRPKATSGISAKSD